MAVYGYALTDSLKTDEQERALFTSGCTQVFDDFAISADAPGFGWRRLVSTVKAGDIVRIADWDRLSGDPRTVEFITSTLTDLGVQMEPM